MDVDNDFWIEEAPFQTSRARVRHDVYMPLNHIDILTMAWTAQVIIAPLLFLILHSVPITVEPPPP